jgi:DNA-binding NarL/FixJ family response regulator
MNAVEGADVVVGKKSCLRGIDERERKTERLAVIDGRTLSRERTVGTQSGRVNVIGFSSVTDCRTTADQGARVDAILYNIGAAHPSSEGVGNELRKLVEEAWPIPVIVITETEDLEVMLEAVDCGAHGCIPSSIGIDVLFPAMKLTRAGGVFLPMSVVLSIRTHLKSKAPPTPDVGARQLFTSRQVAVAEEMRQGKANKIIAYDLSMCENTVKVHVRNIMKKLKAANRTEAAFKLNNMALGSVDARFDGVA